VAKVVTSLTYSSICASEARAIKEERDGLPIHFPALVWEVAVPSATTSPQGAAPLVQLVTPEAKWGKGSPSPLRCLAERVFGGQVHPQ